MESSRRADQLSKDLQRTLIERDDALSTLHQLTSAYANLLASSSSPPAATTNTTAAPARPTNAVPVQSTHAQTEPQLTPSSSDMQSCNAPSNSSDSEHLQKLLECAHACDATLEASVASGAADAVTVAIGVTQKLLELQNRLTEASAAEQDASARISELQGAIQSAISGRREAEAALEAVQGKLRNSENLLEARQKLLDDTEQDRDHSQAAKDKAEERLARIQVHSIPSSAVSYPVTRTMHCNAIRNTKRPGMYGTVQHLESE